MNDYTHFKDAPEPGDEVRNLARWLTDLLETPAPVEEQTTPRKPGDGQLELLLGSRYHLRFYQQLPDFVLALLSHDAAASIRYASLLYHLASCRECHQAYLELYDALSAAVQPQEERPLLAQSPQTSQAVPQRSLGHLSKILISQAEAVLMQARHDHTDADEQARSLLQLAIRMSANIGQSSIRRQSLQDLVRVATLFDGPSSPGPEDTQVHAFTPIMASAGGVRGKKSARGGGVLERSESLDQPEIIIQSHNLEGRILQHGKVLELHVHDLDASLRGHFVNIAIPLGPLFEPVRWLGGNPRAIRSTTPVDETGSLVTLLGETDLLLSNPEERNLLETLFLLLEIRVID